MKIQDILFVTAVLCLLVIRRPVLFVWVGLGCLILAIPLFAKWIFFTAERLTWYAAALFLIFIVISLCRPHKVQ